MTLSRAEPIGLRIEAFRHDNTTDDWPDIIRVTGSLSPDSESGISLESPDARRLGRALIAAADLIDDAARAWHEHR